MFEFQDRNPVHVQVSYSEAVRLTGQPLPYKIEFWAQAALDKAGLKYQTAEIEGRRSITSIDGAANSASRRWVYFVNDVRSPFHINTQTAQHVRSIRFKLESSSDR